MIYHGGFPSHGATRNFRKIYRWFFHETNIEPSSYWVPHGTPKNPSPRQWLWSQVQWHQSRYTSQRHGCHGKGRCTNGTIRHFLRRLGRKKTWRSHFKILWPPLFGGFVRICWVMQQSCWSTSFAHALRRACLRSPHLWFASLGESARHFPVEDPLSCHHCWRKGANPPTKGNLWY